MCNGCVSLTGVELDRYAAALAEARDRHHRYSRDEIARRYDVPAELLPEDP